MHVNKRFLAAAFALTLAPGSAFAASVLPTFVAGDFVTSPAQGTQMFRADLAGLGLTEIGSIKLNDSNSGIGGSAGIYSGFDLDAVFLDVDGLLSTDSDRFFASDFIFSAGSLRPGSFPPPSPSGGTTNGSTAAGAVDQAWATLNDIDAIYFDVGSLTLGDGGSLIANFASEIAIGSSMFLFVGEVSGDRGENVDGLIEVFDDPQVVPLPATAPLLLGALGVFGLLRRRRKA